MALCMTEYLDLLKGKQAERQTALDNLTGQIATAESKGDKEHVEYLKMKRTALEKSPVFSEAERDSILNGAGSLMRDSSAMRLNKLQSIMDNDVFPLLSSELADVKTADEVLALLARLQGDKTSLHTKSAALDALGPVITSYALAIGHDVEPKPDVMTRLAAHTHAAVVCGKHLLKRLSQAPGDDLTAAYRHDLSRAINATLYELQQMAAACKILSDYLAVGEGETD